MLAFTNAKEKQSPTIIGAGCTVTGNILTDHSVQIHGHIIGDVQQMLLLLVVVATSKAR